MIELTPKPVKFSAAHSLPCLGEPCSRKHGHTWMVYATFQGEPDEDGILVPYEIVRDTVATLDHQDLDELLDFPSTGELLAEHIAARLLIACLKLNKSVTVVRVELLEDPSPIPHVVVWTP